MRGAACVGRVALQAALLVAGGAVAADEKAPLDPAEWRFAPLSATRGDFEIRLKGFVQLDGRSFRDWSPEEGARDREVDVRRSRIGAEVQWGRVHVEADFDPVDDEDRLKDLNIALRVSKPFALMAGRMKLPVSPERLRSSARTDFVERSLLAAHLAPDRDWGLVAFGALGKRISYRAGAFRGDGQSPVARAGTTLATRLALDLPKRLAIGASFSQGDVTAETDPSGEVARPNGLRGEGVGGFRFFERHHVNGRRQRRGLDGSWAVGAVSLKAEVLEVIEERRGQGPLCEGLVCEDLSDQVGLGWSATGTWVVTGGKKRRATERAGALQLLARYEALEFDDRQPTTSFESLGPRARNIRPAGVRAVTGGASFWPTAWTRVMANVAVERYRDHLTAPELGRTGTYVTLLGRVQVRLP